MSIAGQTHNPTQLAVLDASAVLAWLRGEPGAEIVHQRLATGVISAANLSETWQKLHQHGVDAGLAIHRLRTLGLCVEPVTANDAIAAAKLWAPTRAAGLSLGDRCCLALAQRLDALAVTADTAWAHLDLGVAVETVR